MDYVLNSSHEFPIIRIEIIGHTHFYVVDDNGNEVWIPAIDDYNWKSNGPRTIVCRYKGINDLGRPQWRQFLDPKELFKQLDNLAYYYTYFVPLMGSMEYTPKEFAVKKNSPVRFLKQDETTSSANVYLQEMRNKVEQLNNLWLLTFISYLQEIIINSNLQNLIKSPKLVTVQDSILLYEELNTWILHRSGYLNSFNPQKREELRQVCKLKIEYCELLKKAIDIVILHEFDNYILFLAKEISTISLDELSQKAKIVAYCIDIYTRKDILNNPSIIDFYETISNANLEEERTTLVHGILAPITNALILKVSLDNNQIFKNLFNYPNNKKEIDKDTELSKIKLFATLSLFDTRPLSENPSKRLWFANIFQSLYALVNESDQQILIQLLLASLIGTINPNYMFSWNSVKKITVDNLLQSINKIMPDDSKLSIVYTPPHGNSNLFIFDSNIYVLPAQMKHHDETRTIAISQLRTLYSSASFPISLLSQIPLPSIPEVDDISRAYRIWRNVFTFDQTKYLIDQPLTDGNNLTFMETEDLRNINKSIIGFVLFCLQYTIDQTDNDIEQFHLYNFMHLLAEIAGNRRMVAYTMWMSLYLVFKSCPSDNMLNQHDFSYFKKKHTKRAIRIGKGRIDNAADELKQLYPNGLSFIDDFMPTVSIIKLIESSEGNDEDYDEEESNELEKVAEDGNNSIYCNMSDVFITNTDEAKYLEELDSSPSVELNIDSYIYNYQQQDFDFDNQPLVLLSKIYELASADGGLIHLGKDMHNMPTGIEQEIDLLNMTNAQFIKEIKQKFEMYYNISAKGILKFDFSTINEEIRIRVNPLDSKNIKNSPELDES